MHNEIIVSATGIICAIGNNTADCLDSLLTEKSGIDDIQILDTVHKGEFKLGEVKMTNIELMEFLKIPKEEYSKYTRTSLLAIIAAKEALENSLIDLNDGLKTGIVSATTVGGMDKTENNYLKEGVDNDYILSHSCGDSTEKIAEFLGITDYRTTISTACSSAANAIMLGANLIEHGIVDRAIVGGVDSLSKFTLNGFNSLMILDREFCKPFDENRKGLNLGEAAGFIVLEKAENNPKNNLCFLSGFANANDAFHETASSPNGLGAYTAMQKAIEMSGKKLEDIDYVNVHGTGTANNDLSEGVAMKRIFGDNIPKFSSTKSYTGHTLAAAAGIEAVFSVLAIQNGVIYPNLNFTDTIVELGIKPQTKLEIGKTINTVLSNSFGFGGNSSSLIFSKI